MVWPILVVDLNFLATMMKAPILIFLLLFSTGSVADFYQAPMQEANWEVSHTKSVCFLRQAISQYGSAEFVQRAGEQLRFSVQEQRTKPLVMKASLKAMPAPWNHGQASSVDHQVYLDSSTGYGRLSVYGSVAEAMIDALLQGQYPTFIYFRDASVLNVEETRVAISAIHFSERYREFAACRDKLQPVQAHVQRAFVKSKKTLKPKNKHPQSKPSASATKAGQSAANMSVKPS